MSYSRRNTNPETGRSWSAHPDQPVADKPLYHFEDYTTSRGKPALSVKVDIRDMAKFYAEHPKQVGGYAPTWNSGGWTDYFPRHICNAGDALQAVDEFTFPAEIKREAARASRVLADVFTQVARLQTVRHLTAGRLDRRKLTAIARHSAAGTYDGDVIRPYKRTTPTPSDLPTLAIVASAGNAEMWDDPQYIPRALTLTLSVLWACEAAGLEAYAALVKGHCALNRSRTPYREAVQGMILAEPGAVISPRAYGVALHRDLWRHGSMTMQMADWESNKRLMGLQGKSAGPSSYGAVFPCYHGGAGVRWAREMLGADLVVGIGRLTDLAEADIGLGGTAFKVAEAVEEIARQARRLERGVA